MRTKGIAFDLDGTLVDTEKQHFDSFIEAARAYGIVLTFEELINGIPLAIGGGDAHIAEGLSRLSEHKISAETFLSLKRKLYMDMITSEEIALRPGALEALCFIQKREIPLSIGTLTFPTHTDILMRRTGLYAFFSPELIVSNDCGRKPKPAPDIYIETARRMNIDPTAQLVCEDSVPGILSARRAGSYAIAFPIYKNPKNLNALINAGAQRMFWDWSEINIEQVLENM